MDKAIRSIYIRLLVGQDKIVGYSRKPLSISIESVVGDYDYVIAMKEVLLINYKYNVASGWQESAELQYRF
jgi:hypothetical protein